MGLALLPSQWNQTELCFLCKDTKQCADKKNKEGTICFSKIQTSVFKLSQYRLQISQYRLQTTNSHNENLPLKQVLAQTQKNQLEKAIMDGRVASQLPPLSAGVSRRFERWMDSCFGQQLWVVVTQPSGWEDWMLGCNHVSQPIQACIPKQLSLHFYFVNVFCHTKANTG